VIALVNVYLRRDVYWVCTNSKAVAGFWVTDGFETVELAASDLSLGEAVLRARNAARAGIPNPPRSGPTPFHPVLQAAGVKTWAQFVKGSVACQIEFEVDSVVVVPQQRDGPGWSARREGSIGVDVSDAQQLGVAVRRTLDEAS
jgi:hypothetical protein